MCKTVSLSFSLYDLSFILREFDAVIKIFQSSFTLKLYCPISGFLHWKKLQKTICKNILLPRDIFDFKIETKLVKKEVRSI